jgi:hypothetical protein
MQPRRRPARQALSGRYDRNPGLFPGSFFTLGDSLRQFCVDVQDARAVHVMRRRVALERVMEAASGSRTGTDTDGIAG